MARFVTCAALVVLAAACDLKKTGDQLTADKVMVGTVFTVPSTSVSPQAFLSADGGGADAGLNGDAGSVSVPGVTTAFVFFGTRTSQALDVSPQPISNAAVSVQVGDGGELPLISEGSGTYEQTAGGADGGVFYATGGDYFFHADLNGSRYTGEVEGAPTAEGIDEFHPAKGYIELAAGASLTFTRPAPPTNQERPLGFVTVFPLDSQGGQGKPTYTSAPQTPVDFLRLLISPADYKASPVTIPGTAFSQANATYMVIFQAAKTGGPETSNLFSGSAFLVGSADVGIVRTH